MRNNARKPMAAFFGHFLPDYLDDLNKKRAETNDYSFAYGKKNMHYSMLIQGSPTNGSFT